MSRNYLRALAAGATLVTTAAALGVPGQIVPVHPVFNNREAIGTGAGSGSELVQVFMGNVTNNETLASEPFRVQLYAADGTTMIGGPQTVAAADTAEIVDGGGGAGTVGTGDVIQIDLATYISVSGTAAFLDIIYDPTGDNDSLFIDADATTTSANDERYFINRNTPTLNQALVNVDTMTPANSKLFLVYNIPPVGPAGGTQEAVGLAQADGIIPGAGDNPNDTEAGPLAATDFQISTDGGSNFSPLDVAGITMFDVADDSIFIEITFDSSVNPEIDDNADNPSALIRTVSAVRDATGQPVSNNAVPLITKPDLAAVSAEWRELVPGGGGAVGSALAVTYNLPIDAGAPGNAAFYNNLMLAAGMTDIVVNGVAGLDPDDNTTVLLNVNAPGADGVAADGLSEASDGAASTGTFSVTLEVGVGTAPDDTFGVTFPMASNTTLSIGDAIAPSLEFVSFHDLNSNGEQDAVALVFNEPMANYTVTDGLTLAGAVAAVFPFSQIDPNTFALVGDNVANTTAFMSSALTVTRGSVDLTNDGDLTPRETNNAIIISFDPRDYDWDNDGDTFNEGDTEEAIPGTGDAGALTVAYDSGPGSITDAAGNEAPTVGATATSRDRAAPIVFAGVFYTGDNQPGGNNNQIFIEQDAAIVANVGDQLANNRLAIFVSEAFQNVPNAGNTTEESIVYGPGSTTFVNGDLLFGGANSLTLSPSGPDADLAIGNTFSVITGSGLRDMTSAGDAQGNELLVNGATISNGVALYLPLTVAIDGTTVSHAAALIDTDDDNFADEIRLGMTQPVDASTLDITDFTVAGFTNLITGVSVDPVDPRVIVIALEDGRASINSTLTVTYNGATDATLINSDTNLGGTGIAVAASNSSFTASAIVQPARDTQSVAIMPLVGTIQIGGAPAPRGTKIFALNAIPTASRVTATHNNVEFSVNDSSSLTAWTNWFLGLKSFVYLTRSNTNVQEYSNDKFGGLVGSDTFRDVISLRINANNIANVTFTGVGETNADRVTNGRLSLCWDVIRSNDGLMSTFMRNGYSVGGTPVASAAVVNSDNGSYSMHISAPISAFNGRARLDGIGRPIIMIVETPSGERFVCSSLLTSADTTNLNGGPLLFRANNRSQGTGPQSGNALNAARFDVDLANVGVQVVYPGWNLKGFPRVGGYANNAGSRPVLPAGLTNNNVVLGSSLPLVGALDQFVFFNDNNGDGSWSISDDGGNLLSSVIVDADCISHFWFTMTSFGVQLNTSVTNLVGGYGFGFFNNTTNNYGFFQFGPPLTSSFVFANGAFPNNSATQGWFLGTVTSNFNPASGFFTSNADADYFITFENDGASIDVTSRSRIISGDNPNDTQSLRSGQAVFIHRQN